MNEKNVDGQAMTPTPRNEADETMAQLAHEAAEHQRVWGLVSSLASLVKNRDQEIALLEGLLKSMQPYSPAYVEGQNARIHHLEQRIVKQKKAFNKLEECRRFEKETEEILVEALDILVTTPNKIDNPSWVLATAKKALSVHKKRKGPRPKAEDAS